MTAKLATKITPAIWEKIVLMVVSALVGGATNSMLDTQRVVGRLDAVEKAIIRIETRLYGPQNTDKRPDRASMRTAAENAMKPTSFDAGEWDRLRCAHVLRPGC